LINSYSNLLIFSLAGLKNTATSIAGKPVEQIPPARLQNHKIVY
jgi:hypothetical protein